MPVSRSYLCIGKWGKCSSKLEPVLVSVRRDGCLTELIACLMTKLSKAHKVRHVKEKYAVETTISCNTATLAPVPYGWLCNNAEAAKIEQQRRR